LPHPEGKLISLDEWASVRAGLHTEGHTIVFTNGCFDLLHPGHIHVLTEAKKLGDLLVLGLNSDASVRRLKGNDRPVDKIHTRIAKLEALSPIDHVIVFEQDTPTIVIKRIRPDILVKGCDYSLDKIVGREIVESYGGTVRTVPFLEGHSTSGTIGTKKL
jgi:rfaE bifunctional protein nucleotidyltransferase chain/domain